MSKSYFEGENNLNKKFNLSAGSATEDQLFMTIRGISQVSTGPILMSQLESRLKHKDIVWRKLKSVNKKDLTYKNMPAVEHSFIIEGGTSYKFITEKAFPHKLLSWQANYNGMIEKAEWIKTKKMKYWGLNGMGDLSKLKDLGLSPRPARTP